MTYLQDGKPKILPPSLTSQVTGNQTSSVKKDVRPKTKIRNSATKQETRNQNGTMDLPLKSAVQQRAALPTGDEAAYDILRRCRQCGILLPLPILNQHQVPCSPLNPAASLPGSILPSLGRGRWGMWRGGGVMYQCGDRTAPPMLPPASVCPVTFSPAFATWFVSLPSHWVTFGGTTRSLLSMSATVPGPATWQCPKAVE